MIYYKKGKKMTDLQDQNGNIIEEITLTIGGEPRLYPTNILSDDAKRLIIRDVQNNQIKSTCNEVLRLILQGLEANAQELNNALPQTGFTIPKPQEAEAPSGLQDEVGVVDDAEIVVEKE